jgi:DNA-binding SARP family transcriptional activator
VHFRLLGSLEIEDGRRLLPVRAGKQRALLALLLLRRGEPVASERLVDELWAGRAPPSALKILQGHVSQLRTSFADAGFEQRLVTQGRGYLLRLEPGELDVEVFDSLLERGRVALSAGSYEPAADLFRDALALWHGPPLAEFAYEPFAQTEIARLEESRLLALDRRIEAELELGRASELVGELESLVAAHPLHEGFRGRLMVALYRSGRQAEALAVYQATRRTLVDELGIEPGPLLQQLEQAILRHDASLKLAAPQAPEQQPAAPTIASPVGRSNETGSSDRRQPVTVLVCELAESDVLAARLDAEPFCRLIEGFSELAGSVFGRHGAQVERLAGDAVLAVFGLPTAHEDDALRAVRSALELRDGLLALNTDLGRQLDVALALRIGVNSGDIVAVDSAPPSGDAVNLAIRLERGADAGEIVLGAVTWQLVRDAARTEPVARLGYGDDADRAFRLLGLVEGASAFARRLDAPLVGREQELGQLRQAFGRCAVERTSSLFTLLGAAGIGKSRLAAEARLELGGSARIVEGRCLPYGDGITFWPLREMLVQVVGDPIEDGLEALLESHADRTWIVASVAGLIGAASSPVGLEEGQLAVHRLLEMLAAERPLVLVFDDLHWAEPALLDFVEQLVEVTRDSPIFALCLARPELLEQRPTWGGGKPNATAILLEQLPDAEAGRVADWLLAAAPLADETRAAALRLAEGNPLFLEQLLAHWRESGWRDDARPLPPTISALLTARLDRLGPAERALLERAAVIGREFPLAALEELVPPPLRPTIDGHVAALMRKELIRVARPTTRARERYRFRHILIRDAAYRALAKRLRAELHERHAGWVESRYEGLEFVDEIVGYHLEQAYRYELELHPIDPATRLLAERAAERLERAGRRAAARSDAAAAAVLRERARAVLAQPGATRDGIELEASPRADAELTLEQTI